MEKKKKNIKHHIAFAFAAACLIMVDCQSGHAQTAKDIKPLHASDGEGNMANGFQIRAVLEGKVDTKFFADEPVIVDVFIKNVSKNGLNYPISSMWNLFQVIVLDRKGNMMPTTQFGKELHANRYRFMGISTMLSEPNQEHRYRILVSRQCDMTLYGNYTVSVAWQAPAVKNGHSVKIVSTPIQLHVGDFNWIADDEQHKR